MKNLRQSLLTLSLATTLSACSAGGFGAGPGGDSPAVATDAIVQLIEYEMLRNLLVEQFELPTNGAAISYLDTRSVLFGGPDSTGRRSAGSSSTRRKATFELADLACAEGLEINSDRLFPNGDVNPGSLYLRLRSRPPDADDLEMIDSINQAPFRSLGERQHAQCVAALASLKTHLK